MIPKVTIVGRPNVGKSSLLNLLARRRISIVDPTAGVTRDRVSVQIRLPAMPPDRPLDRVIELIDTGGYGIDDAQDLTAQIQRQIALAIADADLILLVVDAQSGIVPLDHEVAQLLRVSETQTPVVLVANKVDSEIQEPAAFEAASLGFGPPFLVSAASGRHRTALLAEIHQSLPDMIAERDTHHQHGSTPLLAIAGKRNAGKSTLVNALAGEPRVIVSKLEGTTRDSIDVRFEINGQTLTAIDTAGVRKTKSLAGDIEYYSYHRTLRSIRRADVVLLLIDAAVPVSQVDRQLAAEVLKHYKPCVIVLNKWDLAQHDHTQQEYLQYLDGALKGLSFAPVGFISAAHHDGIADVVAMAMNLCQQAGCRISTGELNRVVEQILKENTPKSNSGHIPKIYYATQLDTHPPTIGLFVNHPAMFDLTYQRFLINRFRDLLPFSEVPIRLLVRGKKSVTAEARLADQRDQDKAAV